MSSTADPEPAEKPTLEPISTSTEHTDFLSTEASENPSKTQHAKSIGTTTPEVEGEEQQLIAAVEDYPTTPISAVDPKSDSLLRLVETPEPEPEKAPLPPSSSLEQSASISQNDAEEEALPESSPLENEQLEARQPQLEMADSSAEIKDEKHPKENELVPVKSEKPLETTPTEPPQTEEVSELVGPEDNLYSESEQVEKNVLDQEDAPLKVEEQLSLPKVTQTAELEKHTPDAVPSLESVPETLGPATVEGDKLLIEEEPSVEAGDNTLKTQDTKAIELDDKPEETSEAIEALDSGVTKEVPEEDPIPAEVPSAPTEETHEGAIPEPTLVEISKPAAETETKNVKDAEPESTYIEVAPVIEQTESAEKIDAASDTPESISATKADGTGDFKPELVTLEEAKAIEDKPTVEENSRVEVLTVMDAPKPTSDAEARETAAPTEEVGEASIIEEKPAAEETPVTKDSLAVEEDFAPKTEEVLAVIPETAVVEETPVIEGKPSIEKILIVEETPEPKAEEVNAVLSSPVTLDGAVLPVESEVPEAQVPEAEVTFAEVEAAMETPTANEIPIEEKATIAELSGIEEPSVAEDKSTIDHEPIPDDGLLVRPVPVETEVIEDKAKGIDLEEAISPSLELKEAVVAEPVFDLSEKAQELKIEEPQVESTAATIDQSLITDASTLAAEDSTLEVDPKKDQCSEGPKDPEDVEVVGAPKGEPPLQDLEAMTEPSTGELPVDTIPESNVVVEESLGKGEVEEIKAEPPLEDLATMAEVPEPVVEAHTVGEESVTKDVPVLEQASILDEVLGVEQRLVDNKEPTIDEVTVTEGGEFVKEIVAAEDLAIQGPTTAEEVVPLLGTQEEVQEKASEVVAPVGESEVGSSVENIVGVEPEESQVVVPAVGVEEQAKEDETQEKKTPTVEAIATVTGSEEEASEVPVEVPEVVVELTGENQPSHGDDLGLDATPGQQEAFEKHKAEAEPDTVVVEEPSTLELIPIEETTTGPEPTEFEGEILPKPQDGAVELPEELAEVEKKQAEPTGEDHEVNSEQAPIVEEAPIAEEAPIVEEAPSTEETPSVEVTPSVEEAPAVEETPTTEETPAVEETPTTEETPAVEETPAFEETPIPEETPVIEETPAVEETPLIKEISTASEAPVEGTPVMEEASYIEDDAVIINHDDAKLEDVAEAEAAVRVSSPVDDEEPKDVTITTNSITETPEQVVEVTGSLSTPEGPEEEYAEIREEPKAAPIGVALAGEDSEDLSQEVSINPFPASETPGNPVGLVPGEKVPEFGASFIDANVKLDPESYENADASNFGVKHDIEEVFSVNPLPAFEASVNPIHLQPGEPIPDLGTTSVGSAIRLDEDSYEKADASNFGVKSATAATIEPEEFFVKPLPASETAGNPIELQPGESIPQIGSTSIESNVKLDEESYEHADASNFGVKLETGAEEVFSVNPLPASETAGNPIELKPGEPVPETNSSSIESNVKLDQESYEHADASNFGIKPQTEAERFSINPLPASETAGNPIQLQPGEPVPQLGSSLIESNVKLDEESYERADASNFGIKPEVESEEFSVNPLPASRTSTNPIDLQPGEPVPEIGSAALESNVKLDEESYQQADASNFGVKSPASLEAAPEEVQEVSINPFPASQTFNNPIELQPGEAILKDLLNIESLDANVKLDEESYERADASNFGVESSSDAPAHTEAKDDQPVPGPAATTEPSGGLVDMDGVAKEDVKEDTQDIVEPAVTLEVEAPSTKDGAKDIELEASPAPTEANTVEPGLFVDKSTGEVISPTDSESNTDIIAASVLGGVAALAGGAAIIVLSSKDDASSSAAVDNKTSGESAGVGKEEAMAKHTDEESIIEPAPQTAPSPVHGIIIPEADTKQVLEDVDTSGAPAIVVSSPPASPTVGKQQDGEGRTVEVIEPTPEVVIEGSTPPKAAEREAENTPEGVRRRLAESTSLSRPVSSGNDTVSTRHHKNVMRTFWNVLFFGWLGGFGRLFGFGKSKKSQRATQ